MNLRLTLVVSLAALPLVLCAGVGPAWSSPAPDDPSPDVAQPGVDAPVAAPPRPRRPPPARPAVVQARPVENPLTAPDPAPAPVTVGLRTRPDDESLREMLLAQSRARIASLRVARNVGAGLTIAGLLTTLAGGCSIMGAWPAGFIAMVTLVPIGGMAVIAGIPMWGILQASINAEEDAMRRLKRFRWQRRPAGPRIATGGLGDPNRVADITSTWKLRF